MIHYSMNHITRSFQRDSKDQGFLIISLNHLIKTNKIRNLILQYRKKPLIKN